MARSPSTSGRKTRSPGAVPASSPDGCSLATSTRDPSAGVLSSARRSDVLTVLQPGAIRKECSPSAERRRSASQHCGSTVGFSGMCDMRSR